LDNLKEAERNYKKSIKVSKGRVYWFSFKSLLRYDIGNMRWRLRFNAFGFL
jgi:hypothetical protein